MHIVLLDMPVVADRSCSLATLPVMYVPEACNPYMCPLNTLVIEV